MIGAAGRTLKVRSSGNALQEQTENGEETHYRPPSRRVIGQKIGWGRGHAAYTSYTVIVIVLDTIVINMDTTRRKADGALFGKTRSVVLGLLLLRPDERFHLRQIARLTGSGLGAVQRELAALTNAGILQREQSGRQVYFQANSTSPIFTELKGLLVKTSGIADVLRDALAPLQPRIRVAFLFGSFARGHQHSASDIDLLLIANPKLLSFAEVAAAIVPLQTRLGREVNPTVYTPAEFARKWSAGHHFIRSVVQEPKVFLVGDEDELRTMARRRSPQAPRRVAR
jgi:predicted nucleotidyltransferase